MRTIQIVHAPRSTISAAVCASDIGLGHYLHCMPHNMTCYEIYEIVVGIHQAGWLVFGWPQSTRCKDWYGSLYQVEHSECQVTKYQVLNLARVWINPRYQAGGEFCKAGIVPGFTDRLGHFRSTLASSAINTWIETKAQDYILRRPPVFLDQPYELRWLMSYCDTKLHRGVIYKQAGFELYSTNSDGIQTWRKPLPRLTPGMDSEIREASKMSKRSNRIRAEKAQLALI
jgi:hypothetical protein